MERERQARLETERARRRHLAVQRERQLVLELELEEDHHHHNHHHNHHHHHHYNCMAERGNGTDDAIGLIFANDSTRAMPETSMDGGILLVASLPLSQVAAAAAAAAEGDIIQSEAIQQHDADTNNAEANSLSYPMERFLVRVDDEGDDDHGPGGIILPIIIDNNAPSSSAVAAAENNDAAISYAMELFLAENAVVGANDNVAVGADGDVVPGNERESTGGSDDRGPIILRQENHDCGMELPLAVTPANVQPLLEYDADRNELPSTPIEWSGGANNTPSSFGSVASVVASNDNMGSSDENEDVPIALTDVICGGGTRHPE